MGALRLVLIIANGVYLAYVIYIAYQGYVNVGSLEGYYFWISSVILTGLALNLLYQP